MNYGPDDDPLAILRQRDRAAISVYAQGDDYHDLIKARLKELARWLTANGGGDVKVFVDTAAVMEKPLAARGGLGWQGKHTNLVSRHYGSWLFLGAIFTHARTAARTRPNPTAAAPAARASISARPRRFLRPYRLDAAALHFLSDHRAQRPDPARIARR